MFRIKKMRNFWNTLSFNASPLHLPPDINSLCQLIQKAYREQKKIKIIGRLHSYSKLILPEELCVSLAKLKSVHSINFYFKIDIENVDKLNNFYPLQVIEELMKKYAARPHWAKGAYLYNPRFKKGLSYVGCFH